jgi:hypothetical protein
MYRVSLHCNLLLFVMPATCCVFLMNYTKNTNDLRATNSFLHSHQIKFAAIRAYNKFRTILWPRKEAPWVAQVTYGLSHMATTVFPCNQLWPMSTVPQHLFLVKAAIQSPQGHTTSTRPGVGGGGGNTEVCLRGEHKCSGQIRRALTYGTCVSCR